MSLVMMHRTVSGHHFLNAWFPFWLDGHCSATGTGTPWTGGSIVLSAAVTDCASRSRCQTFILTPCIQCQKLKTLWAMKSSPSWQWRIL